MKHAASLIAIALALATGPALAQQHGAHHQSGAASAAAGALSEGEVQKIDKESGKVTIKHGPLVNLDMPAMTMVFRVKDPSVLEKLKVGDAIRFKAEKVDGAFTVTEYQPKR